MKIKPYFIVVRFIQGSYKGKVKIWKDYDPNTVWGSALYEILGYADTFTEAKAIRSEGAVI
mgnify:FL=1